MVCAINDDAFNLKHSMLESDSSYVLMMQTPTELITNLRFGLPGRHNLMNALMVLAMAKTLRHLN